MATAPQPGDPRWWLTRLNEALVLRWNRVRLFQQYYEGNHRLLFAGEKFKNAFGGLFAEFADNWCDLVVDAVVERLTVQGFRMDKDIKSDEDAWAIWQANNLDADSEIAHTESLICEESYALVEPMGPGDVYPAVHIEHPSQVIVAMVPGQRRKRAAALKRWVDELGQLRANVYLPDRISKFKARGDGTVFQGWVLGGNTDPAAVELQWEPYTVQGVEQDFVNPLGVVPVIPLRNKPRLMTVAESELKKVVPVQDAINKLILDLMVASEYVAFPQRWATGLPLKVDEETNQVLPPVNSAIDKFLQSENHETKYGQLPAADLGVYTKAIEMLVQHVASQTRTPPHYFYLSGNFPSGESIKSAEAGLVAKVRQRSRHFGEAWEDVIRLCFRAMGDPRADALQAETIWEDPEYRTEGQHVDATMKKAALGVPKPQLWEDLGYSPQQIARFKAMEVEDALLGFDNQPLLIPKVKSAPIENSV